MLGYFKKKSLKDAYTDASVDPTIYSPASKEKSEKVRITFFSYNEAGFMEKTVESIEEVFVFTDKSPNVVWINIDGIHKPQITEKIGKYFNLHTLTLEDIATLDQRPKMEDFNDYLFLVLKMLYYGDGMYEVTAEQVSLVLGKRFVISFQEREGDVFNAVREKIRTGKGRIRKMGADYLAYALLDAIVDSYFSIFEKMGEEIEILEDNLVNNPTTQILQKMHRLKREMIFLRKSLWPLRELVVGLERSESPLIQKSTLLYLRDVYDHTIQVIDTVESFRDVLSGMLDIYLSSLNNKMNEIMKVLTIIATIFIPLTFVAGLYGMNFTYMPELTSVWGYPLVLTVMLGISLGMLLYFKKKRWF